MPLEKALDRLNAGDKAGALSCLLEAWRAQQAPSIADVIDVVSEDLTRSLPPIEGKTRAKFQEAWLDVAGEGRATNVGRLLATLSREPCTQIPERLARLEAMDKDPRITRELWGMVDRCPCTSNPNFPMWTRLFKLLVGLGDVRMRGPLEAKLAAPRPGGNFYDVLYPRIEKALAGLVDPPPLSDEDAAIVQKLDARARSLLRAPPSFGESGASSSASKTKTKPTNKQTEEELIALVLADPDADGPRLVYGDWLLERGDPRGELITLQFKRRASLSKAEMQREKVLLKEHGRRWLGAIEPVIAGEGVSFERGFVSTCIARFRTKKQRESLIGHPLWSTVRTIHGAPVELLIHPVMRSLRVVTGLSQTEAAQLVTSARSSSSSIEELHFCVRGEGEGEGAVGQSEQAAIARAPTLTSLRRLTIHVPPVEGMPPPAVVPKDFAWLLRGPLATKRLEHLCIVGFAAYSVFTEPRPDLGAWLEAAGSLERLGSMAFDVQNRWQLSVTRDPSNRKRWSLALEGDDATPSALAVLRPVLQNVRPKTFIHVELPKEHDARLVALMDAYRV